MNGRILCNNVFGTELLYINCYAKAIIMGNKILLEQFQGSKVMGAWLPGAT